MDYSKINKYLSGHATEQEIKEIFDWAESSSENRKELIQYKKVWALSSSANENSNQVWTTVISGKLKQRNQLKTIRRVIQYAAMLIILYSLGMFTQYLLNNEKINYLADTSIEVPAGQMSKLVLPDGTTVNLNSGSTFTYSSKFNSGERIVTLNGEAFFDVAKDKKHPFIVKTNTLDFKVYGTSFNIQAYKDDKQVNATLVEGSLGVLGKSGKEFTRLVPGDNASYNIEARKLEITKVKLDLYTSWKEGIITFRNESLAEIAKKIERWYNVEIIIQNEKLANEPYIGTIMKNKPVDQILEVLKLTSSMNYKMVQRPDKPTLIYWN